jgi:hypothetical protein
MKKVLLSALFCLLAVQAVMAQSAAFFSKADVFLKANVSSGGVYYEKIKADPAPLDELVRMIAGMKVADLGANEQKAFYINAYNILVIKNVVNHYPIAKPTDVAGFFDAKSFTIAGKSMTLSDLENKVIRPTYKDPRTHFALVCAGKGCPPLLAGAYMPATLETQLQATATKALSGSWIKVDDTKKTVELNQILDWYKDDFLAVAPSLVAYVNKYRTTPIPATYKVSFYTYDWSLNLKK